MTVSTEAQPGLTTEKQALLDFRQGEIGLGNLSQKLGKTRLETMALLAQHRIPIADYDIGEDLQTIKNVSSID